MHVASSKDASGTADFLINRDQCVSEENHTHNASAPSTVDVTPTRQGKTSSIRMECGASTLKIVRPSREIEDRAHLILAEDLDSSSYPQLKKVEIEDGSRRAYASDEVSRCRDARPRLFPRDTVNTSTNAATRWHASVLDADDITFLAWRSDDVWRMAMMSGVTPRQCLDEDGESRVQAIASITGAFAAMDFADSSLARAVLLHDLAEAAGFYPLLPRFMMAAAGWIARKFDAATEYPLQRYCDVLGLEDVTPGLCGSKELFLIIERRMLSALQFRVAAPTPFDLVASLVQCEPQGIREATLYVVSMIIEHFPRRNLATLSATRLAFADIELVLDANGNIDTETKCRLHSHADMLGISRDSQFVAAKDAIAKLLMFPPSESATWHKWNARCDAPVLLQTKLHSRVALPALSVVSCADPLRQVIDSIEQLPRNCVLSPVFVVSNKSSSLAGLKKLLRPESIAKATQRTEKTHGSGTIELCQRSSQPLPGAWDRHVEAFKSLGIDLLTTDDVELARVASPDRIFGAVFFYGRHDMRRIGTPSNGFEITDHPKYTYGCRVIASFLFDKPVDRSNGFNGKPFGPTAPHIPLYELENLDQANHLGSLRGSVNFIRKLEPGFVPADTSVSNRVCVTEQTLAQFTQYLSDRVDHGSSCGRPITKVLHLQSALALALAHLLKATEHRSEKYAKVLAPTLLEPPPTAQPLEVDAQGGSTHFRCHKLQDVSVAEGSRVKRRRVSCNTCSHNAG